MFESWAAEAGGASGGGGGGYWQLALILAGIGFLGIFSRWRKSRMPVIQTAREIRARDDEPNRHRDTADKAIVELLETSRSLNAQVDSKIRVLNRLVKDAGEATARLETLLAEARAVREGAPAAATAGAPAPETAAPETPPARMFMSDLHERIYLLKTEGRSAVDIAKATNLSTTEVEFIIKTLG